MKLGRSVTTALLGTSLVGFAVVSAQAATVNIANPGSAGIFFGYGTAVPNNNVVNSGPGGRPTADLPVPESARGSSGLLDPTRRHNCRRRATAVVQSTVPLYTVTYYLAGSESGDTNFVYQSTGNVYRRRGIFLMMQIITCPVAVARKLDLNYLGQRVCKATTLSFSFHDANEQHQCCKWQQQCGQLGSAEHALLLLGPWLASTCGISRVLLPIGF